ncbi:hypothetical protein RJT34_12747 [Clitoria ternatea]|uniref:25S rRNA (uridine-N(3))-methyltransferase BMT5-like domain-containing protein n=1 Tax=Clitoria ternatea TaxID=43366 RepID=A0AAN9JPD7_CLITE
MMETLTEIEKRVCKNQIYMEQDEEEECAKWVTHYCSDHQILLVGEGDFSFSLSLANSFGAADNIVATSLDSYDDVTKKYKHAKSNIDDLQKLGARLLHEVDATKMKLHSDLKMRRFDRVIFNFPHAGFHGKENDMLLIKMHKDLVLGFFKNATHMLRANGEIHVSHKTTGPFRNWNIEKLATQNLLTLIECADFNKEDYPGYNNKRGDGYRCDQPFPLGKCSTFKFIYNPKVMGKRKRNRMAVSRQQTNLPFQQVQDARLQVPTSVHLYDYPQTSHILKMNETVTSIFGLTKGYTSVTESYFSNLSEVHGRGAPFACYSAHMNPDYQRSLQPWSTSTNVRYSMRDHVRTMDTVPISLHAGNEGYHQAYGGSSNYSREALGRTSHLQPMEPLQSWHPWSTSANVRYSMRDHVRTMDTVAISLHAENAGYHQAYGGSSNYSQEALGRTSHKVSYSFDGVRSYFERHVPEMPRRTLNSDMYGGSSRYLRQAQGRTTQRATYFDRVRPEFERYITEVPERAFQSEYLPERGRVCL